MNDSDVRAIINGLFDVVFVLKPYMDFKIDKMEHTYFPRDKDDRDFEAGEFVDNVLSRYSEDDLIYITGHMCGNEKSYSDHVIWFRNIVKKHMPDFYNRYAVLFNGGESVKWI